MRFLSSLTAIVLICCQLTDAMEVWEGESAVLPCPLSKRGADIIWCKETKIGCQNVVTKLAGVSKFSENSWTEDDVKVFPDSSMEIFSANYSRDNGSFRCESGGSDVVHLIVLQPVRSVTLKAPPTSAETPLTVTCDVEGGNPAPNISWYLGESKTPVKTETGQAGGRGNHAYNVTASKDMNGQSIVCEAAVKGRSLSGGTTLKVTWKRGKLSGVFSGSMNWVPWGLFGVSFLFGVAVVIFYRCRACQSRSGSRPRARITHMVRPQIPENSAQDDPSPYASIDM